MPRTLTGNLTDSVNLLHNPYQVAFLDALAQRTRTGRRAFHRYTLFSGRRGGKTQIGAIAVVNELRVPEQRWWAVAPSYPELHDYVMPHVFKVIPHTWVKNWSELHAELTLVNGSILQFRPGNDPERMRGPGLHGIWFDESRKIPKLSWHTARPMLTENRGVAVFTTSPNGFDWCYKELWVPAQAGPAQRPGYWACKYRSADNPVISQEELDDAKASMDPAFYRQEYEADFVAFEGAIYGDMIDPCVLYTDDAVKQWLPEWPHIHANRPALLGLDPGADHPFAGVLMVLTERGLIVVGEHRARLTALLDHVAAIRRLRGGLQDMRYAIDRSAKQIIIELAQHDIYAQPAENNVIAGIQRVQAWMKSRKIAFVASHVPRLLEELRSYRWKEDVALSGEKRREQPFKLDDDLCDALRYALMLWPQLPESVAQPYSRTFERADVAWAVQREHRLNRVLDDPDGTDWATDLTPVGQMWEH